MKGAVLPSNPPLVVTQRANDVFALAGELDMATRPILEEAVRPVLRACDTLVLDVSELTFMDSSGIHCLVGIIEAMGPGQLILREVRRSVHQALEIAGLADIPNLQIASLRDVEP